MPIQASRAWLKSIPELVALPDAAAVALSITLTGVLDSAVLISP